VNAEQPATCGNQLADWTCTLPAEPHPDRRHRDDDGHWWTQTPPAVSSPAPADRAARWEAAAHAAGRQVDRNALAVYMAVADAEQAHWPAYETRLREQHDLDVAELNRLRGRVAELETFAHGCDAEGCVLPHSSWCKLAQQAAAENDGCTCPQPWKESPQPHAGYCWLVSPPRDEVERMRRALAEAAPVDRAAVLRDFLWRLEQSAGDAVAEKFLDDNPELRRLADEAPPAQPKQPPMDPVHILGIGAPADDAQLPEAAEGAQQ
jgi:hypothetical protein